ncbi:MAG: hypothetical protein ABF379_12745 [Akkermansiaceae bacterium]|jgi:uncharacterized membrane protein
MKGAEPAFDMENKSFEDEKPGLLKLLKTNRSSIVRFLVVLGMATVGAGMMAAGLLAWIVGEEILLLTGVTAGAVFIAASGLGFIKCLEARDLE